MAQEFNPLQGLDIAVKLSDLFPNQGNSTTKTNALANLLGNQTFREVQGLTNSCTEVTGHYLFSCADEVVCDDKGFGELGCEIEDGDEVTISGVCLPANCFCRSLKKVDDSLCHSAFVYTDQISLAIKSGMDNITKALCTKIYSTLTAAATEVALDLTTCNLGTIACEWDKVCEDRDYVTLSSGLLKDKLWDANLSNCCSNEKTKFAELGFNANSFDSKLETVYGKPVILMIDPNAIAFFNAPLYSTTPTLVDEDNAIYGYSIAHPTLRYNKNGTSTPIMFNVHIQKCCSGRNKFGKFNFIHKVEITLASGFHIAQSPCEDCTGILAIVQA